MSTGNSKKYGLTFGVIAAVAIVLVAVYTIPFKAPSAAAKNPLRATADNFFKIKVGEDAPFFGAAKGGTEPYKYAWDFGDGSTLQLQNATHVYTATGSYKVQLSVTDSTGQAVTVSHSVDVYPPNANFTRGDDIYRG